MRAHQQSAGVDPLEGGVNLREEIVQVACGNGGGGRLEPSATFQE